MLAHLLEHRPPRDRYCLLRGRREKGFDVRAAFGRDYTEFRRVSASGQVTAAFAMLGSERLWMLSTVWIVIGILGTGLLNIIVSFSLALFVAIRARNVRGPEQQQFYRALFRRLLKSPWSFVLPVGVMQSAKPPGVEINVR